MRRFTVSLPDDLYARLVERGESAVPPASLQQMVRHAVTSLLAEPVVGDEPTEMDNAPTDPESPSAVDPVDLLVFAVRQVIYGIPVEMVETIAAGLDVHSIPTASGTLTGVAAFREELTEVHDGGSVLQNRPLEDDQAGALIAVPGATSRVLMTVTSVAGLTPAAETKWAPRPSSSPTWVSALTWNDDQVVTVVDPRSFNL